MTALRKALIAFLATAALVVCAAAVAAAVSHDDDSPTPAHTVRDFLVAAVAQHAGITACPYLSQQAQARLAAREPRGMSCTTAIADHAHLDLGSDVDTEAAIKALDYRTEAEAHGRERVTVSASGHGVSFVLRRATQSELVAFSAPPTPWRIDAGLDAVMSR
jgi:hypothetical protein